MVWTYKWLSSISAILLTFNASFDSPHNHVKRSHFKTAASCAMVASKNPNVWILRHNMSQNNDWQNSCRLWLRVYPVTVILISWLLHKFDGLLQTLQDWLLQALHCSSADTGPGDNFANSSQLTARAAGTPLTSLTINSLTIFWSHYLGWCLSCVHMLSPHPYVVTSTGWGSLLAWWHRCQRSPLELSSLSNQWENKLNVRTVCCVLWTGLCVVLQPPLSLPGLSWRWTNGARPRLAERGRAGSRFLIRDVNTELLRMREPATATALTAG